MIRRPPKSPLFPYPPLFRSPRAGSPVASWVPRNGRRRLRPRAHDTAALAVGWLPPAGEEALHGFERPPLVVRSEEHTSELQSQSNLVCRLLLEKKKSTQKIR